MIPKALDSNKVAPHFAHLDRSKCSSEAMIHWWYKYKFIEIGNTFTVKTDKIITYKCANFEVEKTYELSSGTYKPDLVIHTECGTEIIVEMANTHKKKVEDYIDRWIELDRVIVEIDIKNLINNNKIFSALYYKGKCFNFNNRDGGYYDSIGKYKEVTHNQADIEIIKKLDWFWKENVKFNNNEVSSDELINYIDSTSGKEHYLILNVLKKSNCSRLYNAYKETLKLNETKHFEKPLPKGNRITEITKNVNTYLKSVNKNYRFVTERNSNKKKEYYWKNGRKIGKWVADSHYYYLKLMKKDMDYAMLTLRVTKYIYDTPNIQEVIDSIIKEINTTLLKKGEIK